MISPKDLFEMLYDDNGAQQVGKSDVGQLSKKIMFWSKWVIWNYIGQDFCNL